MNEDTAGRERRAAARQSLAEDAARATIIDVLMQGMPTDRFQLADNLVAALAYDGLLTHPAPTDAASAAAGSVTVNENELIKMVAELLYRFRPTKNNQEDSITDAERAVRRLIERSAAESAEESGEAAAE